MNEEMCLPSELDSTPLDLRTSFRLRARPRFHARPGRTLPADHAYYIKPKRILVLERIEDRSELREPAFVALMLAHESVVVAGYDAVEGGGEEGLQAGEFFGRFYF